MIMICIFLFQLHEFVVVCYIPTKIIHKFKYKLINILTFLCNVVILSILQLTQNTFIVVLLIAYYCYNIGKCPIFYRYKFTIYKFLDYTFYLNLIILYTFKSSSLFIGIQYMSVCMQCRCVATVFFMIIPCIMYQIVSRFQSKKTTVAHGILSCYMWVQFLQDVFLGAGFLVLR